jgi:uncharacterized protein YkwD
MKKKLLIFAVLAVTLYIGAVVGYNLKTPVQATPVAQTTANPPTVAELLQLVNAERAKYGVKPLALDPRLNASAQMKANDEVKYNYFGHISPHDGKHGYEYINTTGIYCKTDSENLTENQQYVNTSVVAVGSWIQSKPHHEAMINPKYTLTGFGINGTQIVEHFCQQ